MHTLTAHELQLRLERNERLHLFDVRPEEAFRQRHLRGAEHVPADAPDLVERVAARARRRDPVIVYGEGPDCEAAARAAEALEAACFERVCCFQGGVQAWLRADLPMDGALARTLPNEIRE